MLCDSHSTKPSSSIVGTSEFGFIRRYSAVFVTPCSMPASTRSYLRPSSSAAQSAFFTLTEFVRPQIFSMAGSKSGTDHVYLRRKETWAVPVFRGLETDCLAVAPRVARDEVAAVELPDKLRGSELVVVVDRDDAVAAPLQLFERRVRKAVFLHAHVHALHEAEARAVARRLRALLVVGKAHHHLRVALRLHGAAHDAKAHHGLPVPGDEARNDRLVWTLARPDAVRVAALEHESAAAVLQRDALHHHARAEAHVVRLDEGDHHAARIRRRKVHRAALGWRAMPEVLRALEVDELRARLEIFALEESLGAHIHVVDVADIAPGIGEGELDRLDLQMHAVGPIDAVRAHVEALEHAERHQRDDALAVGRDLVQRIAAIVELQRRHPVRLVRRHVGGLQHAAIAARMRLQLLRQRPAVERLAARTRDLLERIGVRRKAKALAHRPRAAAGHERFGEARLCFQLGHLLRPLSGDRRRYEKALASVADRALEEALERYASPSAVQLNPRRDAARHGHRVPAAHRHGLLPAEIIQRPGRR